MPRDPRSGLPGEDTQPARLEKPPDLVPEEVAEPDHKRNTLDADWLSMATADPALFLKDPGSE